MPARQRHHVGHAGPALGTAFAVLGAACASGGGSTGAAPTPVANGAVEGRVVLVGAPPEPERWPITDEMLPFHPAPEFLDEGWLVDTEGGLANCVVVLQPLDTDAPVAAPLEGALYEKVGPRYEPRVLIVTPDTVVTLRNRDSPCKGFMCRGRRNQFNFTMTAGNERTEVLRGSGPNPIRCDLRPYMTGAIFVSSSPYYALSGRDGRYRIEGLPAGRYRVGLWHERLGRPADLDPGEVRVVAGESLGIHHALAAPR